MKEKESAAAGLVTRRGALVAGAVALGGVILARRFPKILPPTCGNVLRMGDSFTYGMQRALLSDRSLVKEYRTEDLTSFPATGTIDPGSDKKAEFGEDYGRLRAGAFADWRLPVEGRVAKPQAFSLAELKQFPARTQITRHTCEEGWTAIGQWTGVPLSAVLDAAGVLPSARFVLFRAYDGWVDSIDMFDALHPQTILAYGMNGRDLPVPHGAPLRLRVERQMGYKSMKYLRSITVADKFEDGGEKGNIQTGWAWYTGI
jgi:DMSO/TMAO reductase YedYZ molybdopterin-dependent catalytic subunit